MLGISQAGESRYSQLCLVLGCIIVNNAAKISQEYQNDITHLKKIHTLLNLEVMFQIKMFNFGLSDDENRTSEFIGGMNIFRDMRGFVRDKMFTTTFFKVSSTFYQQGRHYISPIGKICTQRTVLGKAPIISKIIIFMLIVSSS